MGRWTQYDEDSYRLPEGFTRIGYDADTRVYVFRDRGGDIYHSAPGNEYGVLTKVSRPKTTGVAGAKAAGAASARPKDARSDDLQRRKRVDTSSVEGKPLTTDESFPQASSDTDSVSDDDNASSPKSDLTPKSSRSAPSSPPPATFHDILPAHLITSPSSSSSHIRSLTSPTSSHHKSPSSPEPTSPTLRTHQVFVDAVRRSALPKMQGVVHGLKRSVTSVKRRATKRISTRDGDGDAGDEISQDPRDDTQALLQRRKSDSSSSTATAMLTRNLSLATQSSVSRYSQASALSTQSSVSRYSQDSNPRSSLITRPT